MLDGVGDASLGQWEEVGDVAFHLRRRLTHDEASRVGGVCDIRDTALAHERFDRVRRYLPPGWTAIQ